MLVTQFDFKLPKQLIAQYPLKKRSDAKLLVLENEQIIDSRFSNFTDFLHPNDIIVRNNTKVIPARLFGFKDSGGKIEILVERILSKNKILALVKSNKPAKANINIAADFSLKVIGRKGQFYILKLLADNDIFFLLNKYGHVPLPPYINRPDNSQDSSNYQTVYAKVKGAVAAPTAGLHFDEATLLKLKQKNIAIADITLHVGAGTFQPVRVDNIEQHKMHSEWMSVSKKACEQINCAKERGGRVIAVGTTSLRALETAALSGNLVPQTCETDIFITPGFKFKAVDLLLTNFHLPKSTLLMLVSAFAGINEIQQAYLHAIEHKYRFFSYGDTSLLTCKQ